jgi:hypothetical protein
MHYLDGYIRIDVSRVESTIEVSAKSNSSTNAAGNSWTIGIFSTLVLFLREMLGVCKK